MLTVIIAVTDDNTEDSLIYIICIYIYLFILNIYYVSALEEH